MDEKAKKIIIELAVHKVPSEIIDREFASQVNDFIEHYKPALKVLAQK